MIYIIEKSEYTNAILIACMEAIETGEDFIVSEATNPHISGMGRTFWYCKATEDYRDSDMNTIRGYSTLLEDWVPDEDYLF